MPTDYKAVDNIYSNLKIYIKRNNMKDYYVYNVAPQLFIYLFFFFFGLSHVMFKPTFTHLN